MLAHYTYFKYIISLLCLLICLAFSSTSKAQSASPQKKAKRVDQSIQQNLIKDEAKPKEVTYDTEETLNYLSNRMAYQVKKRLHLTNEADEAAERKAKKKASKGKFTIFGIEIEKH